jgi:hypothetical protein
MEGDAVALDDVPNSISYFFLCVLKAHFTSARRTNSSGFLSPFLREGDYVLGCFHEVLVASPVVPPFLLVWRESALARAFVAVFHFHAMRSPEEPDEQVRASLAYHVKGLDAASELAKTGDNLWLVSVNAGGAPHSGWLALSSPASLSSSSLIRVW